MNYLLDTSWIIEHFRGSSATVIQLETFRDKGLAISVISLAELYEGIYRSDQRKANERILQDFLRIVTVLEVTPTVAETYGKIRADLMKKGSVIGALDLLIAATARAHELTLVTLDHDFKKIEGLSVEFP